MSKCRSCGAEIVWISMRATGKKMPCDPGLIPFWADIKGKDTVITLDGETVRCKLTGEPDDITNVGRVPHWATCPNADLHRRRGNGKS